MPKRREPKLRRHKRTGRVALVYVNPALMDSRTAKSAPQIVAVSVSGGDDSAIYRAFAGKVRTNWTGTLLKICAQVDQPRRTTRISRYLERPCVRPANCTAGVTSSRQLAANVQLAGLTHDVLVPDIRVVRRGCLTLRTNFSKASQSSWSEPFRRSPVIWRVVSA